MSKLPLFALTLHTKICCKNVQIKSYAYLKLWQVLLLHAGFVYTEYGPCTIQITADPTHKPWQHQSEFGSRLSAAAASNSGHVQR
jgi:hypothetical protein